MLSESNQQNEASSGSCKGPKESLSFKEWKSSKDNLKNPSKKNGWHFVKPTVSNKQTFHTNNDNRNSINYNNSFISSSNPFISSNLLYNSNIRPSINSNGMHFNNYNMRGNNCGRISNCFDNFSALNFAYSGDLQSNFGKDRHGYKNSTSDHSTYKNFFTSDCDYLQRDPMQKPLTNELRYGKKDNHLLPKFDKSCYIKDDKMTKIPAEKKIPSNNVRQTFSFDTEMNRKEPEVYITNPKAKLGGKPYIPKPKIPAQNTELTYEEKKQQWKEYREAMKPFKNRDFYNAKRVVQRLSKKSPNELNEKELIRLTNAKECMTAHKSRLNAKYPNYVKAEDSCDNLGELYVLKTVPIS